MKITLKPLAEQVMVITGASSGIGLATVIAAADKGVRLVLAARSIDTLNDTAARLNERGVEATAVECDVADRGQVEKVAQAAIARFGRIDTWVNDAGISIYGRLDEVTEQDSRRLFDTNFWGVVNGSLAALPHLRREGGALINVGSEVSEEASPLLGMYSASKHAVKGFTDSLRIETQHVDQSAVAITLIQPTAVDTPFPQHGRNYQQQEPKLPTPMIDARQVAEAILHAAEHPTHHTKVGMMSKVNTAMAHLMPETAEKMAAKQYGRQHYDEPPRHPGGALHGPSADTGDVGNIRGSGGRVENKK